MNDARVLVAYGSKHGATAEIARAIGDALRKAGLEVDVRSARDVRSLDSYRVVVLGSAVYVGRWRRDALRLLRDPQLRERDVWLFSTGPVGESDDDPEQAERWTKPPRVDAVAAAIGAHDHVVFGGKLAEDAGLVRKRMARGMPPEARDRRDWDAINDWADAIAAVATSSVT